MRTNIFPIQDKAKPDTVDIRGLNLAAAKHTTVQVTKLPLQHTTSKTAMICFAKSGLTEDL
jgi:hypothetical protein